MNSSESQSPSSDHQPQPLKRKTSGSGTATNVSGRAVKRRASKACQSCRARKVRCNVVEHGSPCTNCRLDEVDCVVSESKRRKKHLLIGKSDNHDHHQPSHLHGLPNAQGFPFTPYGSVNPVDISNPAFRRLSDSSNSLNDMHQEPAHIPHPLYQYQSLKVGGGTLERAGFAPSPRNNVVDLMKRVSPHGDLSIANRYNTPLYPAAGGELPPYIKPLPQRMTSDDITYLFSKKALSIPDLIFRNALMQSYIEYVHPYMPLIELHDFLAIMDRGSGEGGKISLLLFQAVMFAGTAFVDMDFLTRAGYNTRKAARKAFYQKARLLYDCDYENDRIALVQSLLLMTYWYETPDDQKDTWHWMGVAISLAHTIGLHRDPDKSNMPPEKQKLWKRIWWSCFMRDRLVALGMRRPTRIKAEDYDVPMLTLDDFEIRVLSDDNTSISEDCVLIRDIGLQEDLAVMCMAKAKLCLIISHVLSAQYSVLVKYQATQQGQECNTRSNVMLFPKKHDQIDEVRRCDKELTEWFEGLEPQAQYRKPNGEGAKPGRSSIIVQRGLLHMVYYATLSALHRPQVLPSAEITALEKCRELQDISRKKVREASREITNISVELYNLRLSRFLPTTGVTVILPAIIIHLLDIKSSSQLTRDAALQGFCHCMRVLERLRENYAAADYATQFLEAAIRKANIDVTGEMDIEPNGSFSPRIPPAMKLTMPRPKKIAQNVGQLLDAGRAARITPPPENNTQRSVVPSRQLDEAQSMSGLFVPATSSPPDSDSSHAALNGVNNQDDDDEQMLDSGMYVDESFESSLVDYNGNGGMIDPTLGLHNWSTGMDNGMHGESGGFMIDMNWNEDAEMWGNGNLIPQGLGEGGLMRHRLGENNLMRQGLGDGGLLRQGLGEGGLMHQGLSDGSLMHQGLGEMGGQDLTSSMEL